MSDALFLPKFEAPAHVLGDQDSQLTAQVSGLIKNILVDVGDQVRKGQTLVELDCSGAKLRHRSSAAEVDVLKAQLILSRDQLKRAEALRKEETISEDAYSRQHNEVAVLEARQRVQEAMVDQASLQVKHCRLIAPFSGVIAERHAQLGEWTQPGSPLLRLVATDSTQVSAQTSASITEQLLAGSEITFIWGEEELPVAIRHVLPIIDAASRSREVRLTFVDKQAPPGAAGRLRWQGPQAMVPAHFLVKREGSLGIFLLKDNIAIFHPLPHASEGRPATTDLPPSSQLITDGRLGLTNGDRVKVL